MEYLNSGAEVVDCLCIGTSIIVSLEAIHQHRQGKKVLMVDRAEGYGGAWKTIEIDGINDVENAIHYFLPDDNGIKFLKEELKWPIEKSKGKYRYFNIYGSRYIKFKFDSLAGRFLHLVLNFDEKRDFFAKARHVFNSINKVILEPRIESFYVEYGAVGIINSMKNLLNDLEIETRFNTNISELYFDLEDRIVICNAGNKKLICKSLILGHGARLPEIESTDGTLELNEKFHPRPAFHLVVEDESESDSFEVIFENDSLIKYVHDVSRFSSLVNSNDDKRKVFVFALHNHVSDNENLANELSRKLKNAGILGKESKVTASLYSDIILPTLYDEDLFVLKDAFGDLVNVLRTENFAPGVGYYAERWKS